MATNRGVIRQSIIDDVFKRTDKDSQINQAINDTLREMGAAVAPRTTWNQEWVPTVVGREDYKVPSTLLRIMHPIRLQDSTEGNNSTSSYPLQHIPKVEYDRLEPFPNTPNAKTTARPRFYTIWENCILITPLPDSADYRLEINSGNEITILNADVDEPFLSDQWLETIKAGALARLYNGLQQYEEARIWQNIYIYGYAGQGGMFKGGLMLLKETDDDVIRAPLIVDNNSL